jgi:hypothetical protein
MASYSAFGLVIRSDLPLPELTLISGSPNVDVNTIDINVKVETLPPPPPCPGGATRFVRHEETTVYLAWKDVGAFLVRGGNEIVCDPSPQVSRHEFRRPLLGAVLGVLLHQRGLLTLHASAVSIAGSAVAFLGGKGRGKSTMAAALQSRGHALLCDDVMAMALGEEASGSETEENETLGVDTKKSRPRVLPAFPQIKLWPESAEALGYQDGALPTLSETTDKRALRSDITMSSDFLPLRRIYLLEEGERIASEPVAGSDAFAALLAQSYAPRFLGSTVSTVEYFRKCQSVARRVPIYRLRRPMNLAMLDQVAAYVDAECQVARVATSD